MKSNTGMIMTMGKGDARSNSTEHILNKKNCIEVELVGIDDVI